MFGRDLLEVDGSLRHGAKAGEAIRRGGFFRHSAVILWDSAPPVNAPFEKSFVPPVPGQILLSRSYYPLSISEGPADHQADAGAGNSAVWRCSGEGKCQNADPWGTCSQAYRFS